MEDVLITSVRTTGSDGHDQIVDQIVEQITLSFERLGLVYTPQKDDGSGGPTVAVGWDIGTNMAWGALNAPVPP